MHICRSQFDQLRNRSGCKLHCKKFIVPDIPSGTEHNAPDQKQYSQNKHTHTDIIGNMFFLNTHRKLCLLFIHGHTVTSFLHNRFAVIITCFV